MSFKLKTSVTIMLTLGMPLSAIAVNPKAPFSGFDKECYIGVPEVDSTQYDSSTTPIDILSDEANTSDKDHISFKGNVRIVQGNRTMTSDYTQYNRQNQKFNAYGNINYQDGYISIKDASEVETSTKNQTLVVTDPSYQLHGSPARGTAKKAEYDKIKGTYHFEDVKFTTCQENSETWHIRATSIDVDENEVFGDAWNASLWFHQIPVFYLPYFYFPIKNERKTGFLYPMVGYDGDDGLEIMTPFYLNIAPNYDYTLTPTWRGHRGLHLRNEFRYMINANHAGNIIYDYIAHDKLAEKEENLDSARWYKHWDHIARFLDGKLVMALNYNKVREGDYNYFNDYTIEKGSKDKLIQSLTASYNPFKFTSFSLKMQNYQMLIDTNVKPFELLPEVKIDNFVPLDWFSLNNTISYSRFSHSSENKQKGGYEGKRFHAQTKISVPIIQQPFFQLDGNAKLMYTHYSQDADETLLPYYTNRGITTIDPSVNRFMPTFQIQARLILDNDFSIFGHSFSQSLEPTIQYYYAPYRNQDHIGLYDTTDIIQDYFFIFDDNRYAGIDRISDENRLTVGFKSTLSDELGVERALLSIGMAFYLDKNRVKLYPKYKSETNNRSYLNGSLDLKPTDHIFYNGSFIYNTEEHYLYRASSAIEYNSDNIVAQLNYRYTKEGNKTMFGNEIIDMRQFGFVSKFPITDNFGVMLGLYRDQEQKHSIDKVIKINYEDCCWRLSAFAEQVYVPDNKKQIAELDNKFGIQFEMKGLGSLGAKDISTELDTHRLPYSRPFNLSE